MNANDVKEIILVAGLAIALILVFGGDSIVKIIEALRGEYRDDDK